MKRHAPACLRNRDPILAQLRQALTGKHRVLEIASGTGEHALYFASHLPDVHWQPTDQEPGALASIAAYVAEADLPNLAPPLTLNVTSPWPAWQGDVIYCCNMVHISPWACSEALMKGAGERLPAGGKLFLYGPFIREGVETAPSNLTFDQWLKDRDPSYGIRALADLEALAQSHGLQLRACTPLPANNCFVEFEKI